jgi:hypothetical protein
MRETNSGRILSSWGRIPGSMAQGRFTAWSTRWLPHLAAVVAAVQFAILLADALVWHLDRAALVAGVILTALFAGISVLGFWSRGTPAGRDSPVRA